MRRFRLATAVLAVFGLTTVLARCAGPDSTPTVPYTPSFSEAAAQPLLVCPERAEKSRSKVIGPAGGRIEVRNMAIEIPVGAVRKPTEFTMTVPRSALLEVEIVATGHEDYRFKRPVTITLDYSRCGNIESSHKTRLQWMPGSDNRRARQYSFPTNHLSSYALAY
jgi:hypothetical protein